MLDEKYTNRIFYFLTILQSVGTLNPTITNNGNPHKRKSCIKKREFDIDETKMT